MYNLLYIKNKLKAKCYTRYVDDFVILHKRNKLTYNKLLEIYQGWQAYSKLANTYKLRKNYKNCFKMIYEPAEDSFLLRKQLKNFIKKDMKVLDMGTGSGIQALEAERLGAKVLATDINQKSIRLLKQKGIKTIQSDLFENIKEKFDIIIFNPPYLPEEPLEPKDSKLSTTGGKKGNEILEKFLKQARYHLNKNGKTLIVLSSLTPDIYKILKKLSYKFKKLDEQKIPFETLSVYLITI